MSTFIDPLDLEPNISTETVRNRLQRISASSASTERTETFENVLQKEVKQEPTPVHVPKPITANVHIVPEKTKPEPTPSSEPTVEVISTVKNEPIEVETKQIEHNRPKNLREMLEPNYSEKPEPINQPKQEPVVAPKEDQPVLETIPHTEPTQVETPEHQELDNNYVIQRGDTLSAIVASRMKELGMDYSLSELYQTVRNVAQHNGMENPDRIYAGRSIDLSPVQSYEPMIVNIPLQQAPNKPASSHIAEITSEFGMRHHPILDEIRPHNGIDIRAKEGTPILPAKAGVVTFSGEQPGYGQLIDVDHGDGTQSRYAHLSERLVSEGDHVSVLQPLGLSGSTGRTTGPHLHFEFHLNGKPVDPQDHIQPERLLAPTSPLARANRQ